MVPLGWFPDIQPKPLTTPDLDAQAAKAEPWEGGSRGHITVQGIPIAIENPAGSVRSGVDPKGTKWSVKMANHYLELILSALLDRDMDLETEGKVIFSRQSAPGSDPGAPLAIAHSRRASAP